MTKSEIQSIFGSKIVSFHSIFAKAIGNVPAAIMLSQAFFWQEKAKHKDAVTIGEETFFSKTGDEWYEETGLTGEQQLTARKHLLKCGFWIEKRAGLPAKMCYRIDIEILVAVISGYLKTGTQVTVDNRKKKRELTRNSSGKFRQLETVKNGDTIIAETKGEFLRKEEEKRDSLSSSSSKPENSNLEAEKEKALPEGAGGGTPGGFSFCQHCGGAGFRYGRNGREVCPECNGSRTIYTPPPPATEIKVKDPDLPGVTIYDGIPNKNYPTVEPHGEFKRVNVKEEIEKMRTDPAVLEGFVIGQKIAKEKFGEYLDAFRVDVLATGEKYADIRQIRRHFLNWSGCKREHDAKRANTAKAYSPQSAVYEPSPYKRK